MRFFDTSALLNAPRALLDSDPFGLSHATLLEIEHIKTSASKSEEVKYKARLATRWLLQNTDKYTVVADNASAESMLDAMRLAITNDNIILAHALMSGCTEFFTDDLCQNIIAREVFKLAVSPVTKQNPEGEYSGFTSVCISDESLADVYTNSDQNVFGCLTNEYVLLRDERGDLIDALKWDGARYAEIKQTPLKSAQFGCVRAYEGDIYQQLAIDSLVSNQITMLKGTAGTGKSYLALAYLFQQLEKGKIDRVIMFCNPVATAGAAKLGFLPGSRNEKILESGPGMMLTAKLGDRSSVEQLLNEGRLVLLPMSDMRGYDTSGMKAGVYISEAQNTDISLAKLALQRIGEDAKVVIDGDFNAQVDSSVFVGGNNGMRRISEVFRGHPLYGEVELKNIHRSEIARIADKM